MIAYPTNLLRPSASFSGTSSTPVVRTDLDNGLVFQEGRFSTGLETFSVEWQLSRQQLLIFENWFNDTLVGGLLVFGLVLPDGDGYSEQPVRFVGGLYNTTHYGNFFFRVNATIEKLTSKPAQSNRTPAFPLWRRLAVDEAISQVLTLAHRNSILTVRPSEEDITTLRIFPPTSEAAYIYFGIQNFGEGDTLITSQDVDPVLPAPVLPFPVGLPNINSNFQTAARRKTSRLEMESGHPRQYAGLDTTNRFHQVEWEFSLEQLQIFQDFFYVTLESGSLPFTLTIPVDAFFLPVPVRFVGGTYSEVYVEVNRFKVSAVIERIVDQTVIPSNGVPFPLYYAPTVSVNSNRKILESDSGKFFIVNPDADRTISLHIGDLEIEFGLLIIGLGNVLITRGPFVWDLESQDASFGTFLKPQFELGAAILDLGSFTVEETHGDFSKPVLLLQSVIKDAGSFSDEAAGDFSKPSLEVLDVLEDLGSFDLDESTGNFAKPILTIDIP
jgi:hypothetical protein